MRIRAALPAAVLVVIALTAPPASAAPDRSVGSSTPNSCIEANGGDWTACNVGNSGRGDRAYRTSPRLPELPARRESAGPVPLCRCDQCWTCTSFGTT